MNEVSSISGYKPLSEEIITYINRMKELERDLLLRISHIPDCDYKWFNIAKIHFQQGFMALNRSITKPDEIIDVEIIG